MTQEHRGAEQKLERKLFELNILYETTRELLRQERPKPLLDAFLLSAMGAVGASLGFALVIAPTGQESLVVERGVGEEERAELERMFAGVVSAHADEIANSPLIEDAAHDAPRLVVRNQLPPDSSFPQDVRIMYGWRHANGYTGFFGLGAKVSEAPYSSEDAALLNNLLNCCIPSLGAALSGQALNEVNKELQAKNDGLEQALARIEKTQSDLDLNIFHLKTLYDATLELSQQNRVSKIMDAFLLLLMGAFTVESGYLFFFDQKEKRVRSSFRGDLEDGYVISPERAERILYSCMGAVDFKKLTPLSVQQVPPDALPEEQTPARTSLALLLRLDDNTFGLLGLGPKLTSVDHSRHELEVLFTLASNFLAFVKNARSFETIKSLNTDLEQRNIELQQTLDDLTASRGRIEVLERAGAQLRGMLTRQAERVDKVTRMDFLWFALASTLLGLVFNMFNPNGVPLLPKVFFSEQTPSLTVEMARDAMKNKSALLVDARPPQFFKEGHAKGALNMPPTLFDFIYPMKFGEVDYETPIIVYGRNISRLYDEEVALRLKAMGHENVVLLPDVEGLEE